MYVYFIQVEGKNIFKVGKSVNPYSRLHRFSTSHHETLKLVWCIEYDSNKENLEGYFHKLLKSKRKRGEWFNVSVDELETLFEEHDYSDELITDFSFLIKPGRQAEFICTFCGKEFNKSGNLYRHQRETRYCRDIKKKNEEVVRLETKNSRLKTVLRNITDQCKEFKDRNEELESNLQNLQAKLVQKTSEINSLTQLLCKQLQQAETKVQEKQEVIEMVTKD